MAVVHPAPYVYNTHTNRAFDVMLALREDDVLCDIQIETEDGTKVKAHKVVLSSVSTYFRVMFTCCFEEKNKDHVVIKGLSSWALKTLIEFIYTGQIRVTEGNVQVLLPASNHLQLYDVQDACCQFLKTQLNPTNCFSIYAMAEMYYCMELLSCTETFIRQHFKEVVEVDEFLALSSDQILKLISNDELTVSSEENIFESVIRWVKHNLSCRKNIFPELMKHVRFPLMSKEFLQTRVKAEPLVKNSPECKDYIIEALEFHLFKSDQYYRCNNNYLIPKTIRTNPRRPVGLHEVILVVGGEQSNQMRTLEWYDPTSSKWQSGPEISNFCPHAGLVFKDHKVFAVSYDSSDWGLGTINMLDLSTPSPHWVPLSDMLSTRAYPGVAILDNCIYVVGGYDDTGSINRAEVFDFEVLENRLISNMSIRRSWVGVGILNRLVYVVGGSVGISVQSLKSVECYDPSIDRWTTVAEMSVRRKCAGVGTLDGILYAVGGIDGQEIHNSVEAYNPNTGVWTSVSAMQMCRKNPGVVALHGLLYAIGGNNRHTTLASVEVYDPKTNIWSMLSASMNMGRSCAGVTVIDKPPYLNKC